MGTIEIEEARFLKETQAFSNQKDVDSTKPWGYLPPFADDENKKLHLAILDLEESLHRLDASVEEHADNTKTILKRTEKVQQEIQYTNAQCNAKTKEMETEDHLKKLAQREKGRMESDCRKYEKEQNVLGNAIHALEMNVFSAQEQLYEFKRQMNFNAEEMDRWVKEREKIEEDKATLEKYKRQDESLVKNFNLKIHNLDRQIIKSKEELESEIANTQTLQIQLEKTADDFRKAHDERVALLKQWNESVETLKLREQHIENANNTLDERTGSVVKQREVIRGMEHDVASARKAHESLEMELQNEERHLSLIRENLRKESEKILDVQRNRDLLQHAHIKTEKDLTQSYNENQNCRQQLQKLRESLRLALENFEKTKVQIEEEKSRLEQLELQDEEYQKKLQTQERQYKEAENEMTELKKVQYKKSQILFEEQRHETDLLSTISGIASQDKNLRSKISQIDEEILKQEEVLYNINFKVVMMERKVERASGIRSHTETKELHAMIQSLSEDLEKINSEHAMLMQQLRGTENETLHAKKKHQQQKEDERKLGEMITELEVDSGMIQKQIKERQEEKENQMVEEDLLNLQTQKLQDILQSKADEVTDLENRKALMKARIQKKKIELASYKDCLKFELKNAQDDIHRVKMELSERKSRAEKLRLKYETLLSKKETTDDTESHSQEYYMIRAAQEQEVLKGEIEKLEGSIQKAQIEVHGLEKAFSGLSLSNQDYMQSIQHNCESELHDVHGKLSKELDVVYEQLKYRRLEEKEVIDSIRGMEDNLRSLKQAFEDLQKTVTELADQMSNAQHQLQEQLERELRAKHRAKKQLNEAKSHGSLSEELIQLASMQQINRMILSDLRTASVMHECRKAGTVLEEMESNGVRMPNSKSSLHSQSHKSTPRSTRPNSTQSLRPPSGTSTNTSLSIKQMQLDL